MASNPVPVETSSCRYLDGTQHIDIAAELCNIGNSVENLQMDELIETMDGLTYIPQLVPEQLPSSEYGQLPSPEYEQLPAPRDFNIGYQMNPCPLPAAMPDNAISSTSSEDSNVSDHMTPSHPPSEFNNLFSFHRPTAAARTSLRTSKAASKGLKQWCGTNSKHPYPNRKETQLLARTYHLTPRQVRKWFSNRLLRSRKLTTLFASTDDNHGDFSHRLSVFD